MSIATALANLDAKRDALAANLNTMGVTASNTETLVELILKVLDIQTGEGYNTSDATAIASDILEGKIAYGVSGKITGTLKASESKINFFKFKNLEEFETLSNILSPS